jgi:hypothetical protein
VALPTEGPNDERRRTVTKRDGIASDHLPLQAAATPQDELVAGLSGNPESIPSQALLAQVLDRANLRRALKQVRQNKGAPGLDGMTVEALPDYLRHHWPEIREQLEAGRYRPQPVKRVEIDKADGKKRPLGIPTVLDRFIQQAIAQVISALWEPHFHPQSYGFRPKRSAHQAVRAVQANIRAGYHWVVDMDRRGHCFARYADDCNILVKSKRAGERVMASVTRFVSNSLRLTVNPLWWGKAHRRCGKSAVDRPMNRKFLGFAVSRNGARLKVADKALDKLKDRVRELTRRPRGTTFAAVVAEFGETLLGWKAYFGIAEVLSPLRDLDKWVLCPLRCHLWKQWSRAGYRELRKRGVSVREAWHTSKSAHGPWRVSQTPALSIALPLRFFEQMGLPSLAPR